MEYTTHVSDDVKGVAYALTDDINEAVDVLNCSEETRTADDRIVLSGELVHVVRTKSEATVAVYAPQHSSVDGTLTEMVNEMNDVRTKCADIKSVVGASSFRPRKGNLSFTIHAEAGEHVSYELNLVITR